MLFTLSASATTVSPLRLYSDEPRAGSYVTVPVTLLSSTACQADVSSYAGVFYPRVLWVDVDANDRITDLPTLTLPDDLGLVVTPEAVAAKAGLPVPLSDEHRTLLTDAILDAQSDVEAYLGRAITPQTFTITGIWPLGSGEWSFRAADYPVVSIDDATAELDGNNQPTGYFTITYTAGLDGAADPVLRPIRRYVAAHALNAPEVVAEWRKVTVPVGEKRSASTDGQSVSYAATTLGGGGAAGSGAPGSLPLLSSLERWKRAGRRVFQRAGAAPSWPYGGPVAP
jgi:hypothetical protein